MTFRYGLPCGLQLTLAVGSMDCQDLRQEAIFLFPRTCANYSGEE